MAETVTALGVKLALMGAICATAACASLPPRQPARIARAPNDLASAESFSAVVAPWPGDGWWKDYGDAQLTGLIDTALAGSPSLAQAEARLRRADAALAGRRGEGLPDLAVTGEVVEEKRSYNNGFPRQFLPQGYNDYGRANFDFSWELDFWGRNRAAVAAAASEARAAEADAAQARLMLTTSIAASYADLAGLFARRDVAERALTLRSETLRLVQMRVDNGLDTRAELSQAESGPSAARAAIAAIDEDIAIVRNRLAALAGQGPDRGLAIARPSAATLRPLGLPESLAANLLGRRPDLAAARWRAEAAQRRVKGAKAAFYPNINLVGELGVQALHLDHLLDAGSDAGQVGPAVSLPIFRGGRLRAGLRGAEAERDEAVAAYDDVLTNAMRDVADAVASQRSLSVRLAQSRQALAAGEDALRIARLRYQGALTTYQSALLAEEAVLDRRRAVADLEARAFVLDVALIRALGGGYRGS